MDLLITLITISLLLPLLLFMYVYDKGSSLNQKRIYKLGKGLWRKSFEGRTIFWQKISFVSLISLIISVKIFGEYPGVDFLRLVIYSALGWSFWSMFIILNNNVNKDEEQK